MHNNHPGDALKNTMMQRAMSGAPKPAQAKARAYSTVSESAAAPAPGVSPQAGVPDYDAMPKAPTGLPAPVPGKTNTLPPAWQRYATSQKMQQAYRNNWTPNPMLIRLLGDR